MLPTVHALSMFATGVPSHNIGCRTLQIWQGRKEWHAQDKSLPFGDRSNVDYGCYAVFAAFYPKDCCAYHCDTNREFDSLHAFGGRGLL